MPWTSLIGNQEVRLGTELREAAGWPKGLAIVSLRRTGVEILEQKGDTWLC